MVLLCIRRQMERILQSLPARGTGIVSPLPTYAALGGEALSTLPVILPTDRPLLLFCGLVRPYKGLDVLSGGSGFAKTAYSFAGGRGVLARWVGQLPDPNHPPGARELCHNH